MKLFTELPINEIVVGDRRREEMGDIKGLAESIAKYGLLHPIVVDEQKRLVAGGRRLAACQSLGLQKIEATFLGELTDNQRREIELEENLQRKDLTEPEIKKSRDIIELAEIKAEKLRQETKDNEFLPLGGKNSEGRPNKPDSQEHVAKEIGISQQTLSEAKQHVQAVEKYSVLETAPKKEAIRTAREFDKTPEEYEKHKKAIEEFPELRWLPSKYVIQAAEKLREMSPEEREQRLVKSRESHETYERRSRQMDEESQIARKVQNSIDSIFKLFCESFKEDDVDIWIKDNNRDSMDRSIEYLELGIINANSLREMIKKQISGPRRLVK